MDGLDLRATTPFRSFGLRNRLQMTTPYRRAEVLESTRIATPVRGLGKGRGTRMRRPTPIAIRSYVRRMSAMGRRLSWQVGWTADLKVGREYKVWERGPPSARSSC